MTSCQTSEAKFQLADRHWVCNKKLQIPKLISFTPSLSEHWIHVLQTFLLTYETTIQEPGFGLLPLTSRTALRTKEPCQPSGNPFERKYFQPLSQPQTEALMTYILIFFSGGASSLLANAVAFFSTLTAAGCLRCCVFLCFAAGLLPALQWNRKQRSAFPPGPKRLAISTAPHQCLPHSNTLCA